MLVGVILKANMVVMMELVVIPLKVLLITYVFSVRVQVVRVTRARSVEFTPRIVRMKHGLVLVVVHHHAADGTVHSGPGHFPCGIHQQLIGANHRTAGHRRGGVKGKGRGR